MDNTSIFQRMFTLGKRSIESAFGGEPPRQPPGYNLPKSHVVAQNTKKFVKQQLTPITPSTSQTQGSTIGDSQIAPSQDIFDPSSQIEIEDAPEQSQDPVEAFDDNFTLGIFAQPNEDPEEHVPTKAPKGLWKVPRDSVIEVKTKHYFHWEDVQFGGLLRSEISKPNRNIYFVGYDFDINPNNQLTLQTSMQILSNTHQTIIDSLVNELRQHLSKFPDATRVFYYFKINAQRSFFMANRINILDQPSLMYWDYIENIQNSIRKHYEDFCYGLLNRGGGGDPDEPYREYDQWFTEGYHIYDIRQIYIAAHVYRPGGGCSIAISPARELANLFKPSKVRFNLCFWETLQYNPRYYEVIDKHGVTHKVDIVNFYNKFSKIKNPTWEEGCFILKRACGYTEDEHFDRIVYFNEIQSICDQLMINVDIITILKKNKKKNNVQLSDTIPEYCNKMFVLLKENKFRHEHYHEGEHIYTIVYYQRGSLGHYFALGDRSGIQTVPEDVLNMMSCGVCYTWFDKRSDLAEYHKKCWKCSICHIRKHNGVPQVCPRETDPLNPTSESTISMNNRLKQNKIKVPRRLVPKNHTWYEPDRTILFADFETIGDYYSPQHVYSAAHIDLKDLIHYEKEKVDIGKVECKKYFGLNSISKWIEDILKLPKKSIIFFFNGANFDFSFIVNELLRIKYEDFNFQRKNGRYDILRIGKNHITFLDFRRFVGGSLGGCCKSYKVPDEYVKKEFDHSRIKTMEDCYHLYDEIIEYNAYDVIALGILFIKYQDALWDNKGIETKHRVYDYVSSSHLAYTICLQSMPADWTKKIKCPIGKDNRFIRDALYGGRTFTGLHCYYHPICNTQGWKNLKSIPAAQLVRIYERFKECDKTIVYFDYTSLYPDVSQQNFAYGDAVSINTNQFEWYQSILKRERDHYLGISTNQPTEHEIKMICRSFIECDVICPKNLRIPYLDARDEKGNLVWNLEDKKNQVYCGSAILVANNLGYEFVFHKGVRFTMMAPLFKDFMQNMFKFKKEYKEAGDSIKSNLFKSYMNDTTGKNSQHPIDTKSLIFFDDSFVHALNMEDVVRITDFWMGGSIHAYHVEIKIKDTNIYNKPIHLGCQILEFAREKMYDTMYCLGFVFDSQVQDQEYKLPFYSDTDSMMFLREYLKSPLAYKIKFGTELGEFKNETPNVVWFCGVWPAKKVYALMGIDKMGERVYMIKTKGAPPTSAGKKTDDGYYMMKDLEKLDDPEYLKKFLEKDDDLKTVYYTLSDKYGTVLEKRLYIPFHWMEMWNNENRTITVWFNSMKKYLNDPKELEYTPAIIKKVNAQRNINHNKTWIKCDNRCLTQNGRQSIPKGHWDYERQKYLNEKYWKYVNKETHDPDTPMSKILQTKVNK